MTYILSRSQSWHITYVTYCPQNYNLNLIMKKIRQTPIQQHSTHTWPLFFISVKFMKQKQGKDGELSEIGAGCGNRITKCTAQSWIRIKASVEKLFEAKSLV